ncbi:MAG: sigma factor, partial [Thermoleophilaceae bacterium]
RGLAEEMVQETFVRLWRGAGRFDPDQGSVRAYTYTIARRVAVDLRRRRSPRPLGEGEDRVEGSRDIEDGEFEALLLGLDVRDALHSLSAKHREIKARAVLQGPDATWVPFSMHAMVNGTQSGLAAHC